MRTTITAALILAAGLAPAACSSATSSSKPHAAATVFSAHAATVKACKTILAFQKGRASDTFQNDPASTQAELEAEDTSLEVDLTNWVNDLQGGAPYQQVQQDANKVGADCGAVGIALFPTG